MAWRIGHAERKCAIMKVDIVIYPPNGAPKLVKGEYEWESYEQAIYQWSEGNFSCDCNRAFFYDDFEWDCNLDENDFCISIFNEDGICIYDDRR